ncbi:LPS export ABC transporter periplasmic protein LptC [Candidatus Palauibacter sp.]|uniref:LPS export ABC transporter periplasmic protein LptC n=1 Tax=Candidatus Palauibacter sp. TaxID=3101350 RepID=UPI003B5B46AC
MPFAYVIRAGRVGRRAGRTVPFPASVVAAVLVVLSAACRPEDAPPMADRVLPEGIDSSVIGMRTTITRDGIRRALVESDTAQWHSESEIHLRPMKLTFYDVNGRESTEVTSEYGIFHELTGDLEAEGSVVAVDRVDGQRLETEQLRYVNADGRLYGPVFFRLVRGLGTAVEGSAFESDPTLDSVVVLNPAGESRPQVARTPAPAAEDSVTAAEDSVTAAEDSVTAVQDSAVAPEDTMLPDSTAALGDTTAVLGDTTAALGDTTAAPSDKTPAVVPPDSAAAPPDSLVVPPDSLAVPGDTTVAPPDTAVVLPDSTVVPPDTTAALPDSVVAPPDTTARR